MIKFRILSWGVILDYLGGLKVVDKGPYRREAGGSDSKRLTTGAQAGGVLLKVGRGPQAEGCRLPGEAGKGQGTDSPPEPPPEGAQPSRRRDFSPARLISDF